MTFAELKSEVEARGYDYTDSNRAGRVGEFINRAYKTICARYDWPFLEEDKEGTAPLVFTDLRNVLSVTDTGTEETLDGRGRRWLKAFYPDLTESGTPMYWYLENNTLRVFPTSETANIAVRYIKIPEALTGNNSPLIPEEWQYLLVDRAIVDCLKDDDEYQEAQVLKGMYEEGLREMARALLSRDRQGPRVSVRTGIAGIDYL